MLPYIPYIATLSQSLVSSLSQRISEVAQRESRRQLERPEPLVFGRWLAHETSHTLLPITRQLTYPSHRDWRFFVFLLLDCRLGLPSFRSFGFGVGLVGAPLLRCLCLVMLR